jgi:hypothetical protein
MNSPAHDDINPTAPSKVEIERRARKIREFVNIALERNHHDDQARALYWIGRARIEATLGGDDT